MVAASCNETSESMAADRVETQIIFQYTPAPPNYPLRGPKYHLIDTIRPLIEIHWGVLAQNPNPLVALHAYGFRSCILTTCTPNLGLCLQVSPSLKWRFQNSGALILNGTQEIGKMTPICRNS